MKRRTLLKGAAGLAVTGLTLDQLKAGHGPHLTGLASCPEDLSSSSQLAVADPSCIKLLQFTDTHFFQYPWRRFLDQHTRDDMLRLIDLHSPDLILMTGDLWHNNPLHLGREFLEWSLGLLQSLGIPWLFTWGNHDRLDDYVAGHRALTAARNSLYRGGKAGGNYLVQLQNRQGQPLWDLVCMNTNGFGIGPAQYQWLRALQLGAPHALAIFHIPLKQQSTLWQRGEGAGVRFETVGFGIEDGSTIDVLQAHKIKACITGHDHINDFSVRSHGMELIYGRSTGYCGYGHDLVPKGGKLYELNSETGSYRWASVLANGSRWTPRPDLHLDHWRANLWA